MELILSDLFSGNAAKMTSLDIEVVTGSRHDVVKRTIKTLARRGVIDTPENKITPTATKPIQYYVLPKKSTYVVVAQLAPHKISEVVEKLSSTETALTDILSALNSFDVPSDLVDMYIYAIREIDTGRLKLGISRNPSERLKQLQTGNSSKLELVAYKKADGFQDEQLAHSQNKDYWVRGEWFTEKARLTNDPA